MNILLPITQIRLYCVFFSVELKNLDVNNLGVQRAGSTSCSSAAPKLLWLSSHLMRESFFAQQWYVLWNFISFTVMFWMPPKTNCDVWLNFSDGLNASVIIWRLGTNRDNRFKTPINDLSWLSVFGGCRFSTALSFWIFWSNSFWVYLKA